MDWCPIQGEPVTLIRLAPRKLGICIDLMRLHGSEKGKGGGGLMPIFGILYAIWSCLYIILIYD